MTPRTLRLLALTCLSLFTPLLAAQQQARPAPRPANSGSTPELWSWLSTRGGVVHLNARLLHTDATLGQWWVDLDRSAQGRSELRVPLGSFVVDESRSASISKPMPRRVSSGPSSQLLCGADLLLDGRLVQVQASNREEPIGEELDFDWGLGGVPQPGGAIVSTTQPWSEFMTISAVNHDAAHPNAAILLDSGNPAAGEENLMTPGTGFDNGVPRGMLLVVARDVVDANGDDLVDVPRAEPTGGTLVFDFHAPMTAGEIRLVDVDEPGSEIRLYDQDGLIYAYDIAVSPPNSVRGEFGGFGLTRLEIELTGSAGIAEMQFNPCLSRIGFDTSTTGIPLGLPAGHQLTAASPAYRDLLFYFDALNDTPGHPDVSILFDTQNVTGGDFDLATPGPGIGNDRPLGKVLVIAERDDDANGDDVLDVPDDEAGGGVIRMLYYTSDVFFRSATAIDVDQDEWGWVEVHTNDGPVESYPFQSLGNNSVQTITANSIRSTRCIEFHFSGSAGLAEIVVCPENE